MNILLVQKVAGAIVAGCLGFLLYENFSGRKKKVSDEETSDSEESYRRPVTIKEIPVEEPSVDKTGDNYSDEEEPKSVKPKKKEKKPTVPLEGKEGDVEPEKVEPTKPPVEEKDD